MEVKILYCFISHQSAIKNDTIIINDMCKKLDIKNYLIACGNSRDKKSIDNNLYLDCDDTYEGLSDKIYNVFSFVVKNYPDFDYYGKLDRLTKIRKPLSALQLVGDYCGTVFRATNTLRGGNRKYHFGKCSSNSKWNNTPYSGQYSDWCLGGKGYFLSRKAALCISEHCPIKDFHIYEDVYVAETLLKYSNITPKSINDRKQYLFDSEREE